MKYSKAKQNSHLVQICQILAKSEYSLGSRQVCQDLEDQGIHLSRGYVLKLMQKGEVLATQRKIDTKNRKSDIEAWLDELNKAVREFSLKINLLIKQFPQDPDDDFEYMQQLEELDKAVADLSE